MNDFSIDVFDRNMSYLGTLDKEKIMNKIVFSEDANGGQRNCAIKYSPILNIVEFGIGIRNLFIAITKPHQKGLNIGKQKGSSLILKPGWKPGKFSQTVNTVQCNMHYVTTLL